jgi:hypothetical protein
LLLWLHPFGSPRFLVCDYSLLLEPLFEWILEPVNVRKMPQRRHNMCWIRRNGTLLQRNDYSSTIIMIVSFHCNDFQGVSYIHHNRHWVNSLTYHVRRSFSWFEMLPVPSLIYQSRTKPQQYTHFILVMLLLFLPGTRSMVATMTQRRSLDRQETTSLETRDSSSPFSSWNSVNDGDNDTTSIARQARDY